MKIREIADILEAEVLTCEELLDTVSVTGAFGADMMSDVLAYGQEHGVLLTGLCNPQVVRTAEMMDLVCVVFVRGKAPDAMSVSLAKQKGIILLSTSRLMYQACGLLYTAGLDNERT